MNVSREKHAHPSPCSHMMPAHTRTTLARAPVPTVDTRERAALRETCAHADELQLSPVDPMTELADRWVTAAKEIHRFTITLGGLLPEIQYRFRVAARNR